MKKLIRLSIDFEIIFKLIQEIFDEDQYLLFLLKSSIT